MGELGFLGLTIPEKFGGTGEDFGIFALIVEEIGKTCCTHANILVVHIAVCAQVILTYGSEEQKRKYLPRLCSGEALGAFALTEPGAGSDAGAQKTTAVLEGDHYLLDGSKIFITNGGVAGVYIVLAMTDKSRGTRGISAFIVEPSFLGFKRGQKEEKMGQRGSSTVELIFDHCRVPKENLLGGEGEGFKIAMASLDAGRIGVAAQCVGLAQGALNAAVTYTKQRVQFGKPVAANQGLQWMMADMALDIEASRQLLYYAVDLRLRNLPHSIPAAMAKLHASETCMSVTTRAVQLHGDIGYTTTYPVERYMRDAKVCEIYEGSNEIQRIVIARNLLQ
jgi:alkylation response protein AidB-like acyl-CoA dehydrogenase